MDRSVGNAWPTTRTASRLGCRWPRRGRDGTARSRLRLEGIRTVAVAVARARTPRCEVRGLRLRVGNSQPRQQSSPQGASTPRPRIAAPNGACGPIPVGARFNCGSLLGCEPAQGWARATRWVSFPRVMTLVVLASPPRLPTESSEEPEGRCNKGQREQQAKTGPLTNPWQISGVPPY